ncbi:MAG TPA: hypothetical protein VKA75_16820 [Reyranella sp.]|nr:hypothetical protein [Reyranella sp.]
MMVIEVTSREEIKASFSSFSHRALVAASESAARIGSTPQEGDMLKLTTIVFTTVLSGLSLGVVLAADTVELVSVWNPIGAEPDGCAPALTGGGGPTKWRNVETDADDQLGLGVSEQSRDAADNRFPLCIVQGRAFSALGNVDVSVRLRPVMGKVDQAGGLAIRLKDERNYYVVRANALEDNVRLYAVIDGDRRQFAGKSVKVAPTQWHTLRLRAVGDRFTVYFDNELLFEATDQRITAPGRVALWTKADSVTEFVDLSIDPLP